MASDDDIARLLPEAPPPRPVRREASIAEALRRFDGAAGVPPGAIPPPARPPRRPWLGRPQLGVLVSAALIALIGAPAAWISLHDRFPGPAGPAMTNVAEAPAVAAKDATTQTDRAAPPALAAAPPPP
ncbi:MAG: hypothetical protein JWL96_238, partial [Sphingomonas bacterium]|nr:hypothetical protein [Sphingomonas bacterium]